MSTLVKKLCVCGSKGCTSNLPKNPKGSIWVLVGKDMMQEFDLEANYLNHHLFEDLLQSSAEEFGYSYHGALRIDCEVNHFLHILQLLRSGNPSVHCMKLHDLIPKFYGRTRGERNTRIGSKWPGS